MIRLKQYQSRNNEELNWDEVCTWCNSCTKTEMSKSKKQKHSNWTGSHNIQCIYLEDENYVKKISEGIKRKRKKEIDWILKER